jgi:hypothetical protein
MVVRIAFSLATAGGWWLMACRPVMEPDPALTWGRKMPGRDVSVPIVAMAPIIVAVPWVAVRAAVDVDIHTAASSFPASPDRPSTVRAAVRPLISAFPVALIVVPIVILPFVLVPALLRLVLVAIRRGRVDNQE